jgi:hypothetical protein
MQKRKGLLFWLRPPMMIEADMIDPPIGERGHWCGGPGIADR